MQRYAANHPASEDHFPGNPVIPGAVVLSDAVAAVQAATGAPGAPFCVRSAKFLSFVRPGESVTIEYEGTGASGTDFVCRVDERPVLSGKIVWTGKQPL
jgi:3-hydroxyacyl-[acyl-carrier-protein] dehydratase